MELNERAEAVLKSNIEVLYAQLISAIQDYLDSGHCMGEFRYIKALGGDPQWLYRRDWNMAKVTRRGVDAPGEIVFVASDHGGMKFIVR